MSPIPQSAIDAVTRAKGAQDSATELLNAVGAKLQAAVDSALANGATATELEPVQTAVDNLNASTDALAQAVAANP